MFCKYCGKEIHEKATMCLNCGCPTGNNPVEETLTGGSKKGLGILAGIFLGLIGLLVGICLFPANSVERKTFIKGWAIAFAITFVATLVLTIVGIVGASCLMSSYYYYW